MTRQELEQVLAAIYGFRHHAGCWCGGYLINNHSPECKAMSAALDILRREMAPERVEWGVCAPNCPETGIAVGTEERARWMAAVGSKQWGIVSRIRAGEWTPAPELEVPTPTEGRMTQAALFPVPVPSDCADLVAALNHETAEGRVREGNAWTCPGSTDEMSAALIAGGWQQSGADFTRNGWRCFLRSQGDLAPVIVQFRKT